MSHFAVLVITDERPLQAVLGTVLGPWHEYECTGIDDQYVVDVDVTGKVEELWNKEVAAIRLADGSIHDRYNDRFYTKKVSDNAFDRKTGRKEFKLPEGAEEIKLPQHQVSAAEGQSKAAFAEGYGGWFEKGGRFFHHTNPNAKWDWWQPGGRYSGRLLTVDGAAGMTGERSWTNEGKAITGVDMAQRKNLDLDAMKKDQQAERRNWAKDCCDKAKRPMAELDIACRIKPIAHKEWMDLPEPKPRGAKFMDWAEAQQGGGAEWKIYADFERANWELPNVPANMNLEQWIEAAPAISAWGVVMDNQWFEKGEMGWWGMSRNDKADWDDHFNDLWGLIAADQWVSVVDCHI